MLKTTIVLGLCLNTAVLFGQSLPDWAAQFRDAVYMGSGDAASLSRLGSKVEERAKREMSGTELSNLLSLCEYLIGRAYQNENNEAEALKRYQNGLDIAAASVKASPTADGHRMMAENISRLCTLKSTAWVIANGTKVASNARKALGYDPRNAASAFMIAARWIYAPAPFSNVKKGIKDMNDILSGKYDLQKDDYFNVYYSLAYAYNRIKRHDDVKPWLDQALAVYPTNRDALQLRQGKAWIVDSADSR
jgi:tetratricopeptide (TPR) repeat protein